ncbi:hypothetical protein GAGA_1814 [Paraglaciecola agarilytica NO2]|uniref:Uncharacterized protein n=1 Tax=Paraglaciecola agarilytica NO2 TaxID=1125747 RepID=A0ABQ0I5P2_9ALTE|nr:hypothetical protein GAGA_1814 [Paraglaciecola agarilytica NO2]
MLVSIYSFSWFFNPLPITGSPVFTTGSHLYPTGSRLSVHANVLTKRAKIRKP